MTTPARRPPAIPPYPPRDQLDELDALMQRMLALPVSPVPDLPPAEAESRPSGNALGNGAAPGRPSHAILAVPPALPTLATSERPLDPLATSPLPTRPRPTNPHKPPEPWADEANGRIPFWLLPVVWLNWAFDFSVSWTGPPGRWLRGRGGRAALAWTGLLLLLAALAWGVVEGMGWTW